MYKRSGLLPSNQTTFKMSTRSIISLVLLFGLVVALTEARAFRERPKRQVFNITSTPVTTDGRCTSQTLYNDIGEIDIGANGYQDNEDCCFLFAPPIGGVFTVDLEFNVFKVEYHINCDYDYLSYETSDGYQGKDCGTKDAFVRTFTSTGFFSVCFHSDMSQTRDGINFYYYIYPADTTVFPMNTTMLPTNFTIPSNVTVFPTNFTMPSNVTVFPTNFTVPSNVTVFPTNFTVPSNVTVFPTNFTVFPTNFTVPSNVTVFPPNFTIPSNVTVFPPNFTIPSNVTVFPPNFTIPSNVTVFPTNFTVPPNVTVFPTNFTVPSNVTVAPNTTCNRNLTGDRGNFTSPGFNQSYPNRQDCVTTIRGLDSEYTIEIRFTTFDIEYASNCVYDYLEFQWATNKTEKACGREWSNKTIELDVDDGNVTAHFHSDGSVTRGGFSASYVLRRRGVPRNASDCVFNARQHHRGMIQSLPGTGANYLNNLNCSYIFHVPLNHSLHFNFTTFDLEGGSGCPYDYVQIDGGQKWCGTTIRESRVNATGEVVLHFRTDGSVSRRGFVANYHIRSENGTRPTMIPANTTYTPMNTTMVPMNTTFFPFNTTVAPSNVTVAPNTTCNRNLTGDRGNFTSPGFNQSYPNRQDCVTTIRGLDSEYTIEITFTTFDIEYASNCVFDYLEFQWATNKTEKACGREWRNKTIELDVDGGNVTALFHSDGSVTDRGFSASYVVRRRGVPRNASNCVFNAHKHRGMIQSFPGTGANYPNNLNCSYIFNVPRNHSLHFNFTTFDLEGGSGCPYDYVQIDGGQKWCGTTIRESRVNAIGEVVLHFRTDGSVSGRGFVANYHIRAENGTSPANTTVAPSNVTIVPTNVTTVPSNVTTFPSNGTIAPTNTTTMLPSNDCNVESEALEGTYVLPTDEDGFYDNRQRCDIFLFSPALPHVTTINFTRFDVEAHSACIYDSLDVNIDDVVVDKLCGNNRGSFSRQYNTASPVLNMTFTSDGSVTGRGFAFTYKTEIVYCNATINGTSGSFQSPPSGYSNNMNCTYTIHTPTPAVLHFTFPEFDIENAFDCRYDALSMGGEKLCGDFSPGDKTYTSDGTFVMTFTSDASVTGTGFYLSFTSTPLA